MGRTLSGHNSVPDFSHQTAGLAHAREQAIDRPRTVNDGLRRTGRVATPGPALLPLLGSIESAETIIGGSAPEAMIAAAIRDLRQILDHATAEIRARQAFS